ncbi:pancreatic triacylglycerol lipase-like [Arctopsyche grandis]|uniref:pancreatic triacylglycerol lipase-like n=1 Tax=Arctopsyche grandis TaxID=121162 RepID=UPI00406D6F57
MSGSKDEKIKGRMKLGWSTNIKKFLGNAYEDQSAQAIEKLPKTSLKFYVNTNTYVYPLNTAASDYNSSSEYKSFLKTVIIFHGYMGDSTGSYMMSLVNAVKAAGNANVLQYEHSIYTRDNYLMATTNAQYAGEALGKVLAEMYTIGVRNFHLIGLSIGAQVAAFTGKAFFKLTGIKINQITGLDPSGPCYQNETPDQTLTKADANFVDVIHTDMGGFAVSGSLGHVDFFPNGGKISMPGCFYINLCNHVQSIIYYTESANISKYGFKSVMCTDYVSFITRRCTSNTQVSMGYWLANSVPHGDYYLKTNFFTNYALGDAGIV